MNITIRWFTETMFLDRYFQLHYEIRSLSLIANMTFRVRSIQSFACCFYYYFVFHIFFRLQIYRSMQSHYLWSGFKAEIQSGCVINRWKYVFRWDHSSFYGREFSNSIGISTKHNKIMQSHVILSLNDCMYALSMNA